MKTYKILQVHYSPYGRREHNWEGTLQELIESLNPYGYSTPKSIKGLIKNLNKESDRKYGCCYSTSDSWSLVQPTKEKVK